MRSNPNLGTEEEPSSKPTRACARIKVLRALVIHAQNCGSRAREDMVPGFDDFDFRNPFGEIIHGYFKVAVEVIQHLRQPVIAIAES